MRKTGKSRAVVLVPTAMAALGLATVAGCAPQDPTMHSEPVSTQSAAGVVAEAQASSCPSTVPHTLTSNAAGLSTQLEPIVATRLLLCVYATPDTAQSVQPGGSDESAAPESSGAPASATITDASAISTMRNALNALTAPPTTPVNCPNDNGSSVLGVFSNGQQEVEVLMTTSGCPEASNGQRTGWVGASDFGNILGALLKG